MAAVTAEKAAREAQLVELVVECHRLFRILKWEPDQPLDYQILSSLDPFVEEHRLVSTQHIYICIHLLTATLRVMIECSFMSYGFRAVLCLSNRVFCATVTR
jgi:hypothetical protein